MDSPSHLWTAHYRATLDRISYKIVGIFGDFLGFVRIFEDFGGFIQSNFQGAMRP
jgi:hypothetical protein